MVEVFSEPSQAECWRGHDISLPKEDLRIRQAVLQRSFLFKFSKRASYDLFQGRGLDLPFDKGAIIREPELEYGAFGFQDI